MSAAKSGNNIYITSSGNTLASITTDIADTTFIEKTSTAPDIYTVKGNVARYLRVRNGGTLTIGDSADYSVNETLQFDNLAHDRCRFYVDTGGTLLQYGDTPINFSSNATYRSYYSYFNGKVDCLGNATYKPVWQNYRGLYFAEASNSDSYSDDVWHLENMIIGSGFTANDYAIYFAGFGKMRSHIFKDIMWDKTYGRGNNMYALTLSVGYNGIENVTFEDLDFNNTGNYPLFVYNSMPKIKGATFGTTASWKCYLHRAIGADSSDVVSDYDTHNVASFGQRFLFLENCTFENLNSKACCLVRYQMQVLFKGCEWQTTSSDSIQCDYQGRSLMWSGNTFTGGYENYDVDYGAAVQWVYDLTLTVNDENGDPLENATVLIEQSGSKEKFIFKTKANGKLANCHDIECALLTWKHQYGNSKTTDMEYWSDSSNSTKHTVTVFKDGYRPYTEDYVMDQARNDTIQLDRLDVHSLVF